MTKLSIISAPDPYLRTISKPVKKVDDELRALMDAMVEAMYAAFGVGLAAVQVGVPKRVIVMDMALEDEPRAPQFFINPEISWTSDEMGVYEEGCLSLPEHYADVERPAKCKFKYLDYDGKAHEVEAEGLLATCIQHEIDHLNGILFIDHISPLKRRMILKKLTKAQREKLASHTL